MRLRRVTWINTKKEGVKSGSYDVLKLSRLALTCKSNKYNEAGTGDLGVLTTNETSPMKMATLEVNSIDGAGSTRRHNQASK